MSYIVLLPSFSAKRERNLLMYGSMQHRPLRLLTGSVHPQLAHDVVRELDDLSREFGGHHVKLTDAEVGRFPSSETRVKLGESVRGCDVFVMQSHCSWPGGSINDALMEMFCLIDAARRASAASVTAVCPFLGYARQDRMASGREPVTASLMVNFLEYAGADRIMCLDLHSGQTQGFTHKPFDLLVAMPVFLDYLRLTFDSDIDVVSPDAGRAKVAERYVNALGRQVMPVVHKVRTPTGVLAKSLVGDVTGLRCVLVDDIIDTAGTICAGGNLVAKEGATEVYGMATHPVLSEPALERIQESAFTRVIVTDSLPIPANGPTDKLVVLSVAPTLARAIWNVHTGESISAMFSGYNHS